jgi:hypothetical protein
VRNLGHFVLDSGCNRAQGRLLEGLVGLIHSP